MSTEQSADKSPVTPFFAAMSRVVIPTQVFEFKGLRLRLRYMPKIKFQALVQNCTITSFDNNTKSRRPQLDEKRFSRAFLQAVVEGWDNVTLRTISSITNIAIDGYTDAELDAPIPYSVEALEELCRVSYDLDDFISKTSSAIDCFRANPTEAEVKN